MTQELKDKLIELLEGKPFLITFLEEKEDGSTYHMESYKLSVENVAYVSNMIQAYFHRDIVNKIRKETHDQNPDHHAPQA